MNFKNQKPPVKRLKGLDSLFGEEEPTPSSSLPTERITLPAGQPRRYFDTKAIAELTESIKQHGILQPLLVRTLPDDDKYELVAGERRYRAAIAAGLDEVPVVIRLLSDEEALALALIENLQRENLNPVEETEGILQLLALRLGTVVSEVVSLLYRMLNDSVRMTNNVISHPEAEVIKEVFTNLGLMSWESFISLTPKAPHHTCTQVGVGMDRRVAVGTEATNYTGAGKRAIKLLINSDFVIPRLVASCSNCLIS